MLGSDDKSKCSRSARAKPPSMTWILLLLLVFLSGILQGVLLCQKGETIIPCNLFKYDVIMSQPFHLMIGVGGTSTASSFVKNIIKSSSSSSMTTATDDSNEKQEHSYDYSLAVLVAGSTDRFLFDSFVTHVVEPAAEAKKKVEIDYFAILTLNSGPAFRQSEGYMGHLARRDKSFANVDFSRTKLVENTIQNQMLKIMSDLIGKSTTTNVRAFRLLEEPIEHDPILNRVLMREKKTSFEDLYEEFPMMDRRPHALERTKAGNKNMIGLFLALESLWKNEFLSYEAIEKKKDYDYVLIIRDDALWIQDFDLISVIESDPTADAYILSCDARKPKMSPREINDHGILIKRSKARIVGSYVTSIINSNVNSCHKSVQKNLHKHRGCNSEMILKYVLEKNDIKVKLVPQSLLPFERAVLIDPHRDGKSNVDEDIDGDGEVDDNDFYCYHEFCQSLDNPLSLPKDTRQCKDIIFS